jgi:hypothetical protein
MRRLKHILDAGDTVLSGWCGITDPRYLEAIAEYDFDAVVLDMQHGFFDETSIQNGIDCPRQGAPGSGSAGALGYGLTGDGFWRSWRNCTHDQHG